MYLNAYQKYDKAKATLGGATSNVDVVPPVDNGWVESMTAKAASRLEMVLAESKRQKDEGVKVRIQRFYFIWAKTISHFKQTTYENPTLGIDSPLNGRSVSSACANGQPTRSIKALWPRNA